MSKIDIVVDTVNMFQLQTKTHFSNFTQPIDTLFVYI
jgi:hypothetical protein